METQLLRDENVFPTKEILDNVLNDSYPSFESLMETVTDTEYGLTYQWNFYKDGKSWLCKVSNKKKTVFWASVWDGYFKISFFFTEKHLEKISTLNINEKIKEDFFKEKPIGRLLPMIFNIYQKNQLSDLLTVIEFKKNLK